MKPIRSILILLCGVILGTLIQSSHGQKRKANDDWKNVLLGKCEQIHSNFYRLKCYDERARQQKLLEDLGYGSPAPSVNQNMQNSPGGMQSGDAITFANSATAPTPTIESLAQCLSRRYKAYEKAWELQIMPCMAKPETCRNGTWSRGYTEAEKQDFIRTLAVMDDAGKLECKGLPVD